jgi:glycine dehydrogenase
LREVDRFCDAMIAIGEEIQQIAAGDIEVADSALRNAPHTAMSLVGDWDRAYTRAQAVYPTGPTTAKYWPATGRIDNAYGDRNLNCTCAPVSDYA